MSEVEQLDQGIRACLARAGVSDLPEDASARLEDFGFDSLALALSVAELQREFAIKLPLAEIRPGNFQTVASVRALVLRAAQEAGS
jgi:acyl carrier protein